jgi:hypothetical protein
MDAAEQFAAEVTSAVVRGIQLKPWAGGALVRRALADKVLPVIDGLLEALVHGSKEHWLHVLCGIDTSAGTEREQNLRLQHFDVLCQELHAVLHLPLGPAKWNAVYQICRSLAMTVALQDAASMHLVDVLTDVDPAEDWNIFHGSDRNEDTKEAKGGNNAMSKGPSATSVADGRSTCKVGRRKSRLLLLEKVRAVVRATFHPTRWSFSQEQPGSLMADRPELLMSSRSISSCSSGRAVAAALAATIRAIQRSNSSTPNDSMDVMQVNNTSAKQAQATVGTCCHLLEDTAAPAINVASSISDNDSEGCLNAIRVHPHPMIQMEPVARGVLTTGGPADAAHGVTAGHVEGPQTLALDIENITW